MNKFIKSLFLSIILSGVIFLLLYYFSLLFINAILSYIILVIILFFVFILILSKSTPKYSKKEVIDKYNLPVVENTDVALIKDTSLLKPVDENNITPFPKDNLKEDIFKKPEENLKEDIPKKPREIPKQNVNYRNYAEVFKTINKNIQDEKKEEESLNTENNNIEKIEKEEK